MYQLILNFIAAIIAIVNPVGLIPMWSELTGDTEKSVQKRIAFLVVLTGFIILLIFLLSGKYILEFFSIDLAVFEVAGGIMLLLAGISMISGNASQLQEREEEGDQIMQLAKQRFRKIVVPMSFPRIAGPGSITTVILYGARAESIMEYSLLSVILLSTLAVLFFFFAYSKYLENNVDSLMFNVFTRVFGIIIVAIGIQFMTEGLGDIFPNWLEGGSVIEEEGPNIEESQKN